MAKERSTVLDELVRVATLTESQVKADYGISAIQVVKVLRRLIVREVVSSETDTEMDRQMQTLSPAGERHPRPRRSPREPVVGEPSE